jgi:predicted dehydrogenase
MNNPPASSSRREFLQSTGFAAMSSLALAAAQEEEAIRVLAIGCGSRGCELIRTLTTIDDVAVGGVADPYGPHLERGWQYAGPFASSGSDYRPMLDRLKPDAVIVATPLDTHAQIVIDAATAGAGVYCEKLLCYSLAEAEKIAGVVNDRQTVFQIGLQLRANAVYRQARAMIETGLLGKIVGVDCRWHRQTAWRRPVPVKRDDPEFNKLDREMNWWLYADRSHGLLSEFGSHQFDLVAWLLGAPPRRILASGGIDIFRDGREVADNATCVADFVLEPPPAPRRGGGMDETDTASYTTRMTWSSVQGNGFAGASETIHGTRGTLRLSPVRGELYRESPETSVAWTDQQGANAALVTAGKTLKEAINPWAPRGKPLEILPRGNDTRDALVAFVESVRSKNRQTLCGIDDAIVNTRVTLAAQQSLVDQTWVDC